MINFTVGPVMSCDEVLRVAREQTPYFRTEEFSKVMLENETYFLRALNAPHGSRCVFLTSSGTGAMESCVMNLLNSRDKVIVINGGTFGQRFVDLCELHRKNYSEIKCEFGCQIKKEQLAKLVGQGYTALLVNMHETSSGLLYDMELISDFCKQNGIMLIVDAISSFIADDINMEKMNASAVIVSSQKALAVQPGISAVALDAKALERIESNPENCMYLSMKEALKNMERGQTPFTPAVTILLQIHKRFQMMETNGGIEVEREHIKKNAAYFRENIKKFPLDFVIPESKDRSNAITSVKVIYHNAEYIFNELKNKYNIWICPNGGVYKDEVFRVGHIGALKFDDYDRLFYALEHIEMKLNNEQSNKGRIYVDKVLISGESIREFYDERAKKFREGERTKYTTVLLGDNHPDYAETWNEFEKRTVLPYLNIDSESSVLDIGCGVGRWAESLVPICKEYVGTDFSFEMVSTASEIFENKSNVRFVNCSFQELFSNENVIVRRYDAIVIAGVSMYINDEDLRECYGKLLNLLKEDALIYIEESVGVGKRLTLNHIWSENLNSNYDAIYRTREEYLELMAYLINQTEIVKEGFFNELDKNDMSETSHWFVILRNKHMIE